MNGILKNCKEAFGANIEHEAVGNLELNFAHDFRLCSCALELDILEHPRMENYCVC
jgi:hypothetical protein